TKKQQKPNVVIIFLDDSGYGDFRPFSQEGLQTPHVQTLAEEGRVFTNFHVPQAICSASRSALISGCYPGRTKVFGAHGPKARGLETTFPTIGEIFKAAGYKTAIFGKWHCGDQPDTRPHARGFDETCGLMYSNDMWKHHPENPDHWGKYPLQFWENGKVTIEDVGVPEQKMLTRWYTEHAVDFINRHKDEPFLLYVPHSMPHVPIFCSDEFEGKSGIGLYGDVTLELDWSVGEINKALKDNGIDKNTIVIFSSDNGPWISYGNHAGKTPFREAKATSFDGGNRSACIIKYPNELEANSSSNNAFFSVDLLPTLSHLAGVEMPNNEIDGRNVWDLISGEKGAKNPHEYYALSTSRNFEGVMSGDGKWKLHLPHSYRSLLFPGKDGQPGKYETKEIELSLFDMENDPYESTNVIEDHTEVAENLMRFAELHKLRFYEE
ncbi:MAG: sulfatase, partial [Cyclobacteriaceae bacterium]|nr:sulfatase [Cyclobacteriaceae bacterium]